MDGKMAGSVNRTYSSGNRKDQCSYGRCADRGVHIILLGIYYEWSDILSAALIPPFLPLSAFERLQSRSQRVVFRYVQARPKHSGNDGNLGRAAEKSSRVKRNSTPFPAGSRVATHSDAYSVHLGRTGYDRGSVQPEKYFP